MEELTKIKVRQQAIAFEMLQAINNPALDGNALKARLISYRRQLVATTVELDWTIAELDKDVTIPVEVMG